MSRKDWQELAKLAGVLATVATIVGMIAGLFGK